ncbi:hypothetical protein LF929_016170 [Dickeya oryzae]|uniref:Uncharacterized protein n=1 Tax=Dickeya oryzae TaxID=1240404 RepID=A0AB39INC2_9GAMM|nr:hypothetical protein [Dickeya oryzae]MCA6990830.1 hypothetical protein [Dickeya oryzae]
MFGAFFFSTSHWENFPVWEFSVLIFIVGELSMNNTVFLHTPYEPGVALRQDVFNKQFVAVVSGQIEYRVNNEEFADDLVFRDASFRVTGATITEVVDRVTSEVNDRLENTNKFHPKYIQIHDRFDRLVLCAVYTNGIRWTKPVQSDAESADLRAKCDEIDREAELEASDDYSYVAERLWESVRVMLLADVDRRWRQHPEVLSIL